MLAFVADPHVANHRRWGGSAEGGLNQRGWECVGTLEAAVLDANNRPTKPDAFVVLGDLFDGTRPPPPLVAATTRALKRLSNVDPIVLLGNHDRQSMHDQDHSCASMSQAGVQVIVSETVRRFADTELAIVPYGHGEAKDWLTSALANLVPHWPTNTGKRRVLATHLGIWDDDTPAYLRAAKDAVGIGHLRWLCDAHKIDAVFAGNWHAPRSWGSGSPQSGSGPVVCIPGTLCPATFSDPPHHGSVIYYDPDHNTFVGRRLPTPLFVTAPDLETLERYAANPNARADVRPTAGELRNHHAHSNACRAYLRAIVRQDEVAAALELRSALLAKYPTMIVHVEARGDEAKASVKEAARAAVEAGLGDLSETYADLANVAEPGTKEGVAKRLAEYRKGAQ